MSTESLAIREDMLAEFNRYYPKQATQVFDRLRRRWGELTERRLYKILKDLLRTGELRRIGTRYACEGYVRAAATISAACG
jgi:hypothetical protein